MISFLVLQLTKFVEEISLLDHDIKDEHPRHVVKSQTFIRVIQFDKFCPVDQSVFFQLELDKQGVAVGLCMTCLRNEFVTCNLSALSIMLIPVIPTIYTS